MATDKQKEVKGKVKKLLLGKKELLIDDEETSVEEQYMFNVDGQEDDSAFDPSQRDGLTRHFRAITWGNQDRNRHRDYDDQAILIHSRMQKRVEALERTHGRKWQMMYGKRADQDKRGGDYMRDGYAILLRKTNASIEDYRDIIVRAVSLGFTGVEVMPAGTERIIILDARPTTRSGQLMLKVSSGGRDAAALHPAKLLFGQVVYGQSVILFSQIDIEEARVEPDTNGNNNSKHFFQLVKKSTGLQNFLEVNGRYPYTDELRNMNTQQNAFKGQTATGTDTARISADQPVTILYNKPEIKKAEDDAADIITNLTGGRGQTAPSSTPATSGSAVKAVGELPSFNAFVPSDIAKLQEMLTKLGYDTEGIDGEFGSRTKFALMEFQNETGLAVDGIVGKRTLAKLNSEYAKKFSQASAAPTAASGPTSTSSTGSSYTGGYGGGYTGGSSTQKTVQPSDPAPAKPNMFANAIEKFKTWAQKDNNMNDVVIPASVLLAIGIGGAFAWRKFIKGRENRRLARMLAKERKIQREMEMLLRQQRVPVDMLRNNRDFMGTVQRMEQNEMRSGQYGYYGGRY